LLAGRNGYILQVRLFVVGGGNRSPGLAPAPPPPPPHSRVQVSRSLGSAEEGGVCLFLCKVLHSQDCIV